MKTITFLVLCSVILMSCQKSNISSNELSNANNEICVKVTKVSANKTGIELKYSGLIHPEKDVPISFQLPATIEKVMVEEGDLVKKGTHLAQLDKTTFESAYKAALAIQEQAKDAYYRLKKVYDNGSLPEIKWEEVKSKLEQANSAAQIARQNLDNCTLIAPFNGIIGLRNIEEGANAIPGLTAFQLIDIQMVNAKIAIPENEINKIEKGQTAWVYVPALNAKGINGTVDKVSILANKISKTYDVNIIIDNKNCEIKPGMVCNVSLSLPSDKTPIMLPLQSVMQDESGINYVYVIDPSSKKAIRKTITTSGIINNRIGIASGVENDDLIVIDGQHKLNNNTSVRIIN
ncbi:MAG: efflux RND transporter periplasmic adaptor subunit [Marinilabiliaceae bacterium]|nr:efflux RND transporter periplasmic adaptor subunit [Marinilabiliaceae bacterium]